MDNIFKIEDLRGRLKEHHELPCCSYSVQLKDMVPGSITVFTCPDKYCGYEWQYSWCHNELEEDWEARPRYHCVICRKCGDYGDAHCKKCNKCYFAGTAGFECPCGDKSTEDTAKRELTNMWTVLYLAGFDNDSITDFFQNSIPI
ncbi:uncharacterized protein LOC118420851 [Branchiostoma floridae]|uniref:Uncharacterized protein LOC118420851 n=1 Tax=Branchiostoma floridae TaxID=7739 RepID=A0A9J7LIY7_BRAFL|nr:uncharacterized protein LOC118420851 [Branchiostoma floridae]